MKVPRQLKEDDKTELKVSLWSTMLLCRCENKRNHQMSHNPPPPSLTAESQHSSIATRFSCFHFGFAVTKYCFLFPSCTAAFYAHCGVLWVQRQHCLIPSKQQGLADSSVNCIPAGLGAPLPEPPLTQVVVLLL